MFERLYDVSERAQVNYIGYISDRSRYDFAIVYTNHFFGKPLVVCMQTNRTAVLSESDLHNLDHLQDRFKLKTREDAEEMSLFLQQRLPALSMDEQYTE